MTGKGVFRFRSNQRLTICSRLRRKMERRRKLYQQISHALFDFNASELFFHLWLDSRAVPTVAQRPKEKLFYSSQKCYNIYFGKLLDLVTCSNTCERSEVRNWGFFCALQYFKYVHFHTVVIQIHATPFEIGGKRSSRVSAACCIRWLGKSRGCCKWSGYPRAKRNTLRQNHRTNERSKKCSERTEIIEISR